MAKSRVLIDIDRFHLHLIECGIYDRGLTDKILRPLKEEQARQREQWERMRGRLEKGMKSYVPASLISPPIEVKNEVPDLNWDKMPLLMSKSDITRYLDLPDKLVLQWIKEGKIKLRKRVGMRPYALTEELKEAFPSLYNELKQAETVS